MALDFLTTLQQLRAGTYDYTWHYRFQQLQKTIRAIASEQDYVGAEETKTRIAAVVRMYQQQTAQHIAENALTMLENEE